MHVETIQHLEYTETLDKVSAFELIHRGTVEATI